MTRTAGALSLAGFLGVWLVSFQRPRLVIGEWTFGQRDFLIAVVVSFLVPFLAFAFLHSRGNLLRLLAWGIILFAILSVSVPIWESNSRRWGSF